MEGLCGPLEADLQVAASELTLRDSPSPALVANGTAPVAGNAQTLTEVRGAIESLPGGTRAQLQFRLAGIKMSDPAKICIVRDRQSSPPASGFELYTGGGDELCTDGGEIPCSLLAMGLAELKPLGGRSRFHGYIWGELRQPTVGKGKSPASFLIWILADSSATTTPPQVDRQW